MFPFVPDCVRVDCDLDEWNQWTQCKACGEPRQRNRTIKRKEECGGSSCLNFQQMEEQTCPNTCATGNRSIIKYLIDNSFILFYLLFEALEIIHSFFNYMAT